PVGWPNRAFVREVWQIWRVTESAWQGGELARNRGKLVENGDAGRWSSRRRWLTGLGELSAHPRSAPRITKIRARQQRVARETLCGHPGRTGATPARPEKAGESMTKHAFGGLFHVAT